MMHNRRIYGLDVWRAGLLLVGPLIHSGLPLQTLHLGSDPFLIIDHASALFRMPAFFFIAGFLAAHAQNKQDAWLRRRSIQLGVPLVTMWFVTAIVVVAVDPHSATKAWIDPQHLWFVADLLVFSAIFFYGDERIGAFRSGFEHVSPPKLLVCFIVLSCISTVCRQGVDHLQFLVLLKRLLACPTFVVFYAAGFVVQRNSRLFALVQNRALVVTGFAAFFAVLICIQNYDNLLTLPHQHYFLKLAVHLASGVVSALMCCTIMASAISLESRPALVANLSRASYSIYLFHLPVIYIIAPLLVAEGASGPVIYFTLAITSFGVSWAIHETLVARSALARFLFNGAVPHHSAIGHGRLAPDTNVGRGNQ